MEEQFDLACRYQVEKISLLVYKVSSIDSNTKYLQTRLVTVNTETKLQCDCNSFDITGIICRHTFQTAIVNQFNDINRFKLGRWWLKTNTIDKPAKHFDDSIMDQINNSNKDYNVVMDDPSNNQAKERALSALNQFRAVNNISTTTPRKGRPKSEQRPKSFIEKSNN